MHGSAPTAPIGLTDALHNLLRLVEREHQRIADVDAKVTQIDAALVALIMRIERERDRQHIADLEAKVEQLTALLEANEATARTHRGRIDSLEMRMQ